MKAFYDSKDKTLSQQHSTKWWNRRFFAKGQIPESLQFALTQQEIEFLRQIRNEIVNAQQQIKQSISAQEIQQQKLARKQHELFTQLRFAKKETQVFVNYLNNKIHHYKNHNAPLSPRMEDIFEGVIQNLEAMQH